MTIEHQPAYPYPSNLNTVEDIRAYLQSLFEALVSAQSGASETMQTELDDVDADMLDGYHASYFAPADLGDNYARAWGNGAGQAVTSGVWTKIELPNENYDPGNHFNTSTYRFTASIAGYYYISGAILWGIPIADKIYFTAIYVNGSCIASNVSHTSNTDYVGCFVSDATYLEVGDYVELYGYNNADDTPRITGTSKDTFLCIHILSFGTHVGTGIASTPQVGEYRIKSIRMNHDKELIITYDETPEVAPAVYPKIGSNPQGLEHRVVTMRLDASGKLVIVYDSVEETVPASFDTIISNPGSGEYRIKALRLDADKKLVIVYDNTPI